MLGRPFKLEGSRPVPLAKAITAEAVLQGLSLKNAMFPGKKPRTPTYNCFVKQDHDYAFFRRSLTEQLAEILGAAFPHWRRADPGAVEIWGFLIESHLYLGLRLSSHALRYRGQDPAQRAAALRPTVAAAMVLVGAPMPGERVLDPMCGTGTILAEALAREPGVTLAGGDVDPEAVRCARARLANVAADICEWNAASLPVAPGSVDCIISNLPWGHTYASVGGNRQLYAALLREWAAKLKPSGRMVLLSDDAGALTEAAAGAGLRMTEEHEVRVLGRWATLRRLHKRATANG